MPISASPVDHFYAAGHAFQEREVELSPFADLYQKFASEMGPAASQIASFNHWLAEELPVQIQMKSMCHGGSHYGFHNVQVKKPVLESGEPMYPYIARKHGMSYRGEMVCEVVKTDLRTREVLTVYAEIGLIPVLVGSSACWLHGRDPAGRHEIFEDGNEPLGYYIVNGSERAVVTEDKLAFSQAISSYSKARGGAVETTVTSHGFNGDTVISAFPGKIVPRVKVSVISKGMKGVNTRVNVGCLILMDALLQYGDPDRFAYEAPALASGAAAVDTDARRVDALDTARELIMRFVPDQYRAAVSAHLLATEEKYGSVTAPLSYIVSKRLKNSNTGREAVVTAALAAARERTAAAYATGRGTLDATADAAAAVESRMFAPRLRAGSVAGPAPDADRASILLDYFADLFPEVAGMHDKAVHVAGLVARHCLVAIGALKVDNRDGWENKRVKNASGWMSQHVNGCLKFTPHGSGITGYTDELVKKFAQPVDGVRENTIQILKRDTQIALWSLAGQVNTPSNRQSKQTSVRMVQPSQLGYVCLSETPATDACGLTKQIASTAWTALRRSALAYAEEIIRPVLEPIGGWGAVSGYDSGLRPHPVSVDTVVVGWCRADEKYPVIRDRTKRHRKYFDITVMHNRDTNTLETHASGGRLCFPVLPVGESAVKISEEAPGGDLAAFVAGVTDLMDLFEAGLVEMVSAAELQYCRLADRAEEVPEVIAKRAAAPEPDSGWLRLVAPVHPLSFLGVAAATMPWANTCQAPRVNFESNQAGQANNNSNDCNYARFDNASKRMDCARPTVESMIAGPVGLKRAPAGRMMITAYMALANNGEDGIIVNSKAFAGIRMTKTSTFKASVQIVDEAARARLDTRARRTAKRVNRLCNPSVVLSGEKYDRDGKYAHACRHLGEDGLPKLGAVMLPDDILIGIVTETIEASSSAASFSDGASVRLSATEAPAVVDRIEVVPELPAPTSDRAAVNYIVRVRVRDVRPVTPGDKMASRQSQKGTIAAVRSNTEAAAGYDATSGTTWPGSAREALNDQMSFRFAKALPRIAEGPNAGVEPDIVVNPAAIPTRMTTGILYEMLASLGAVYTGERVDGTSFSHLDLGDFDRVGEILESRGLARDGKSVVEFPGGQRLYGDGRLFIAPICYRFLRHVVKDKARVRRMGKRELISNGPVQGRGNDGGLRCSEMEKFCMTCWGAPGVLYDRFTHSSDLFILDICANCGYSSYIDVGKLSTVCRRCPPGTAKPAILEVSFVIVLIMNMLIQAGIATRFRRLMPVSE